MNKFLQILVLISVYAGSRDPFDDELWLLIPQGYTPCIIKSATRSVVDAIRAGIWEASSCAAPKINDVYAEIEIKCAFFEKSYKKRIVPFEKSYTGWTYELHNTVENACAEMRDELTTLLDDAAYTAFSREEVRP